MTAIGESDYRAGAKERLAEAYALLRHEQFGGCIYLAGRAVEGILRAVIWKSDPDYASGKKALDTGHDLRDLFRIVRNLGVLADGKDQDAIGTDVQRIARLWWNNIRFLPTARIQRRWYDLKEVGGRRTIKTASQEYYDACSAVIRRCEAVWHTRG